MIYDWLTNAFYIARLDKNFLPIHYRGFWDIPLAFLTEYNTELYLFYLPDFDDEIDDYPPNYEVYEIKEISLENAIQNNLWHPCSFKNKTMLGEIPKSSVEFDVTIRKFVNSNVLKKLIYKDIK